VVAVVLVVTLVLMELQLLVAAEVFMVVAVVEPKRALEVLVQVEQ
jgi:hypothetical protein